MAARILPLGLILGMVTAFAGPVAAEPEMRQPSEARIDRHVPEAMREARREAHDRWSPRYRRARRVLGNLRHLEGTDLTSLVRGAAGLADVPLDADAPGEPSSGNGVGLPVGLALPPTVRGPILELLRAVRDATALSRGAVATSPRAAARLRETVAAIKPMDRGRIRHLERLTEMRLPVDRAALTAAAARVADAVDRAVPRLQGSGPRAHGGGCDLADQPPVLCVGGAGSSTYTSDYMLVVDLGGDDVHAHSAGGADPTAPGGLPVSLTLDMGGDDRYESSASGEGVGAVQGGGVLGGVGVLVDVEGRDTYTAAAVEDGGLAFGQGLGISGVGILADLSGSDSHTLSHETVGVDGSLNAAGFGHGSLGGVGILADAGGDDTYLLSTGRPDQDPPSGLRLAEGFGAGGGQGVGLFVDAGGDDTMRLEATGGRSQAGAGTAVSGFGFGATGGSGVALLGPGRTDAAAVAAPGPIPGPVQGDLVTTRAFGTASIGGFGGLHDAGGSDRYVAEARYESNARATATEDCGCPGAAASAEAGPSQVFAFGTAVGGVGLLEETGGDDEYRSRSLMRAEAVAVDDRPSAGEDAIETSATVTVHATSSLIGGRAFVQGTGVLGGLGALRDASGDDRYEAETRQEAYGEALGTTDDLADLAPAATSDVQASEIDQYAQGVGQLGGAGVLEDLGGDDHYRVTLVSRAEAVARDRRGAPARSPALGALANASMPENAIDVYAQGVGVVGAAGVLRDIGGDDGYEAATRSEVVGRPSAMGPEISARSGVVVPIITRSTAQGAGALGAYGELWDGGGADTYTSDNLNLGLHGNQTSFEEFPSVSDVQANGLGPALMVDVDTGTSDVYTAAPEAPTGNGTRGEGVWTGRGAAVGINSG